MSDEGRTAVYAAEVAAFEGTSYESLTGFDELVATAAVITSASWWPRGRVAIRRTRSDAVSSSARARGTALVIRLAALQLTPATLIHELAHVLAGIETGHGAVFRRAHVDLVGYSFGDTEAGWLVDAYAAMGLGPGERTWAQPPVRRGAGGPLAL